MKLTNTISAAKTLWDYMRLDQTLFQADAIVVAGSYDDDCALVAAELYHQDLAPVVVMSGGVRPAWRDEALGDMTEAEAFASLAIKNGVPESAVLLENRAANTSENLMFSAALLKENNCAMDKLILVQKPSFERRLRATAKYRLPDTEFCVASRNVSPQEYCDRIGEQRVLSWLVGDFQRLETYRGVFLMDEDIPADLWPAFHYLAEKGYTDYLMEPFAETLKRVNYIYNHQETPQLMAVSIEGSAAQ